VLLTREADYAVRCVLEVARAGHISASQVAAIQGISPTFLGKIVQVLGRAGILSTRRGVGGGIALAVPPEDITLLQVIEAVEGPLVLNDCLASPPQCSMLDSCPAYPHLCRAQNALRDALDVSFDRLLTERDAAAPSADGNGRSSAVAAEAFATFATDGRAERTPAGRAARAR
jgi:Rrf2 family protein